MSRLPSMPDAQIGESAQTLFEQIRKSLGKVPNAYALIGGHSPAALGLLLNGDRVLSQGQLSPRDIEAIRLTVSELNGCDYCVAAHATVGKLVGLKPEEIRQLRAGEATGQAQRDALVGFARQVSGSRGPVQESVVQGVMAAGYTPGQIIEALLAIALIGFTNLVNRVNDTPIDFPKPE